MEFFFIFFRTYETAFLDSINRKVRFLGISATASRFKITNCTNVYRSVAWTNLDKNKKKSN